MSVKKVDFEVKSFDNTYLKCTKDLVTNPKATVLVLHGLAEHLKRYDYITDKLTSCNFNVYRYDFRGHGDSDGKRGYVNNTYTFVKDLKIIIDIIKTENKNTSLFILAQGLGGHIISILGSEYNNLANGIIFCSPLICNYNNQFQYRKEYSNDFNLVPVVNVHNLSHDYDFIHSYENDGLILNQVTISIYNALEESCRNITNYLHKFSYPCLILHSSSDPIVDCEDSKFLFENIISNDKEIKILNGLYHKLLEELIKDDIIKSIIKWIEKRL